MIKNLLAAIAKMLRRTKSLPEGISLRAVLLNETLVFYCTTCELQHHRPARASGTIVEVRRADGHLYAFQDIDADTHCSRCHTLTPFPLIYTDKTAARKLAARIDPRSDYAFVRIEPKEPR